MLEGGIEMVIEKPIFIIGSGRSGTSVLYNLLSTHPELGWFSNYSAKFYNLTPLPLLHRILDLPLLGSVAKQGIVSNNRYSIKPSEAGRIYHDYCGFESAIKSTEDDLNPEAEQKLKAAIRRHLRLSGKKRFLNKQTANTQRIRLIDTMFPDAQYIHIIRDGRAVANSMFNVSWWNDTDIWWLDGMKAAEWEKQGKPAIELCGLHWMRDVKEILENKYLFGERYIELKYEDFIQDVHGTMKEITDFCGLGYENGFTKLLPTSLPNMNQKWKENLTDNQKDVLVTAIGPFLKELGYED